MPSARAHGGVQSDWGEAWGVSWPARWGQRPACTGRTAVLTSTGICRRSLSLRGLLVFSSPPFPPSHNVVTRFLPGTQIELSRSSPKTGAGSSDFRITTKLLSAALNVRGPASDSNLRSTPGTSPTDLSCTQADNRACLLFYPAERAFRSLLL